MNLQLRVIPCTGIGERKILAGKGFSVFYIILVKSYQYYLTQHGKIIMLRLWLGSLNFIRFDS